MSSSISTVTIDYLNTLSNRSQNGVKLTQAIQKAIYGPFPINPMASMGGASEEFLKFLNTGQFSTRMGKKGDERKELNFELPPNTKKIFIYDEQDLLLKGLLNACINLFVQNTNSTKYDLTIDEYVQLYYKRGNDLPLTTSQESIRKHFYDNYFYNLDVYQNYWRENDNGTFSKKFKDGANPSVIARAILSGIRVRIDAWVNVIEANVSAENQEAELIKREKTSLSEVNEFTEATINPESHDRIFGFYGKNTVF